MNLDEDIIIELPPGESIPPKENTLIDTLMMLAKFFGGPAKGELTDTAVIAGMISGEGLRRVLEKALTDTVDRPAGEVLATTVRGLLRARRLR